VILSLKRRDPDVQLFIDALSPLDGRYAGKLAAVRALFSEAGLMRERVRVECAWLLALAAGPASAAQLKELPQEARGWLEARRRIRRPPMSRPSSRSSRAPITMSRRWSIGSATNLRRAARRRRQLEWVHFACTSEDINNLPMRSC
jgi:adenylosuccinate lyase